MNKIRKAVYDAIIRAFCLNDGDCFRPNGPWAPICDMCDPPTDCFCYSVLADAEKAIMEANAEQQQSPHRHGG